jgi:predicted dehydrogenase
VIEGEKMPIRLGLVGYGVGGKYFHSPYIAASREVELVGIVARAASRVSEARKDHPLVPVYSTLDELIDAGVDAVTVSTPPHTRRDLVLTAMRRGVAVLADKPFAPSAAAAADLVHESERSGVALNVFHNRRWDTDIVTAKEVLASGALGRLTRLDLRCDQDDEATLEAGPEGGLLRDLGSHVVDQALFLLGPARAVSACLDVEERPEGATNTGFAMTITHHDGSHSHVSASKVNRLTSRELRLHGTEGSYVSDYSDVQFEAILAGRRPSDEPETWGVESEHRWGTLATRSGSRKVPSLRGDYTELYDRFGAAVAEGGAGPVPARDGVAVLRVLDAARASADRGETIEV